MAAAFSSARCSSQGGIFTSFLSLQLQVSIPYLFKAHVNPRMQTKAKGHSKGISQHKAQSSVQANKGFNDVTDSESQTCAKPTITQFPHKSAVFWAKKVFS